VVISGPRTSIICTQQQQQQQPTTATTLLFGLITDRWSWIVYGWLLLQLQLGFII